VDHAITHGLDFSGLGAAGGGGQMPAGFSAVVSIGGVPVIAAAENPRRIWIGLTASQWQAWGRSADFVHFGARAIGWCGGRVGSGEVYRGQELPPIGGEGFGSVGAGGESVLGRAISDKAVIRRMGEQVPIAFNANRPPLPSGNQVVPPLSLRVSAGGVDLQPILAAAASLLGALGILIGAIPLARRGW
jgi:hypothetical protein